MISTTYTIQMASKLSGVGVHTIRAWEKRYKALEPSRDAAGHRTYSKTDVEKLILLSELCLLGYTISKVAGLNIVELKALLMDLGKSEESLAQSDFNLVSDVRVNVDVAQVAMILSFAFKSYKLDIINLELSKLKSIISSRSFALEVVIPLYKQLLKAQEDGTYNVHQAQALRSILKFHCGFNLYHPNGDKDKSTVHLLIAGMEGDMQDIMLGIVGLLCHHYNYHYTYLGADISAEALVEVAKSLETNVVLLGPSNVLAKLGKTHFQNYIEKISNRLPSNTELIIAGESDVESDRSSLKRLITLEKIEALDEYLASKLH